MRRNTVWAAVLLALALTGAGCAHSLNDDQITTNVKARMFSDAQLKGTSLRVAVKDGVATLSGQVPSVSARYEAFKVATETAGVKQVTDDMTVELPPMGSQTASNTPPGEPAPAREARHVSRHAAPARVEPAPAPDENAPAQPPEQNAPVPPDTASPAIGRAATPHSATQGGRSRLSPALMTPISSS